jgi:flavin reductase (DIM6/NTAB) family NADH-FMN oxidoreductase RutF
MSTPPGADEADRFKRAMRRLAAAVTIVSTVKDGEPAGLLATAVCSVSVAPPTLLACINRSARSHAAIEKSGVFCVNVLGEHQIEAARNFLSVEGADRFKFFRWSRLATGAPAIDGAVAVFDCEVTQAISAETHTVLIGRTLSVKANDAASPLLYFEGGYRALRAPETR